MAAPNISAKSWAGLLTDGYSDPARVPDGGPEPVLRYAQNFDDSDYSNFGAQEGASLSLVTGRNGIGQALRASYPSSVGGGANYIFGGYDMSPFCTSVMDDTNHVYIDFYARKTGVGGGSKLCKLFGQRPGGGTNYANTTFSLIYGTGAMEQVSFGDGSGTANDTGNSINFNGTNKSWAGRSFGLPDFSALTPQNANWLSSVWADGLFHRFQLYAKFNTGDSAENEDNDGEFFVAIDDVEFVNAAGIFNRHYSNGPLESVGLFQWAQSTGAFDLTIGEILVSQHGWVR